MWPSVSIERVSFARSSLCRTIRWCTSLIPSCQRPGLGLITSQICCPTFLRASHGPAACNGQLKSSVSGYVSSTESHQSGCVLPTRSIKASTSARVRVTRSGTGGFCASQTPRHRPAARMIAVRSVPSGGLTQLLSCPPPIEIRWE